MVPISVACLPAQFAVGISLLPLKSFDSFAAPPPGTCKGLVRTDTLVWVKYNYRAAAGVLVVGFIILELADIVPDSTSLAKSAVSSGNLEVERLAMSIHIALGLATLHGEPSPKILKSVVSCAPQSSGHDFRPFAPGRMTKLHEVAAGVPEAHSPAPFALFSLNLAIFKTAFATPSTPPINGLATWSLLALGLAAFDRVASDRGLYVVPDNTSCVIWPPSASHRHGPRRRRRQRRRCRASGVLKVGVVIVLALSIPDLAIAKTAFAIGGLEVHGLAPSILLALGLAAFHGVASANGLYVVPGDASRDHSRPRAAACCRR